ncbi:MAG: hypothetical protein EBV64_02900 [Oxalobacteraceae bacterium]|jgi:hypothetical protein|nr:hypothetical protein [Oxalobacteraceae bacterium]
MAVLGVLALHYTSRATVLPAHSATPFPYTKVLFEICIHAALKHVEERPVFDMGRPIWQMMATKAMNGLQQSRYIHISFPRDTPDESSRH